MQSDPNILQIDNLSKYFGGLAAVSNCTLKIKKGSITGIIGPNGSGKTTIFNIIAGNLKGSNGKVIINNENITSLIDLILYSKKYWQCKSDLHRFAFIVPWFKFGFF